MMNISFKKLLVFCKKSIEEIDLSHHITFFHGKVSSGKSTIARLIDFCMGGNLENTPAINREFIKSELFLVIEGFNVSFVREHNSQHIVVTWQKEGNPEHFRVNAPISASPQSPPIFGESIFCFSDLVLYLWGMDVLKVTKNNSSDSMLHRLSIRNFFWYCYLKQEKLDSSFFRFDEPLNLRTTRQTIRFILGHVNQKLVDLEAQLARIRESKTTKRGTIAELNTFLKKFNITQFEINSELSEAKSELSEAEEEKKKLQNNYLQETHASDKKRIKLIKAGETIQKSQAIIIDLEHKISKLNSLRSELVSSLYKIDRSIGSNKIFSNQVFEICPCCGEKIEPADDKGNNCSLCKQAIKSVNNNVEIFEIAQKDTEARIKDIENSIENNKKQLGNTNRVLSQQISRKKLLDSELNEELKTYESSHMSQIREVDKKISMLRERIRNLLKSSALPKEIGTLEEQLKKLEETEKNLLEKIRDEAFKIKRADNFVSDLEEVFAHALKEIGVPGVGKDDKVVIDTKSWAVKIAPANNEDLEWGFFEAGSGGKKTLINVCFLLALHIVGEKYMLDLPNFMIIDTPMKNIDKEVNEDLFVNFYNYLYSICENQLANTQIIIIDNAIVAPDEKLNIDFKQRYMTPDESDHPPLISYYRGS